METRSSWVICVGPKFNNKYPLRERQKETGNRQKTRRQTHRWRDWINEATSPGRLRRAGNHCIWKRRGRALPNPPGSREGRPCQTPWSQTSGFKNYTRIHFFLLSVYPFRNAPSLSAPSQISYCYNQTSLPTTLPRCSCKGHLCPQIC